MSTIQTNASGTDSDPDILVREVRGKEMHPEITKGTLVQLAPRDRVRGGGGTYFVELDNAPMLVTVQRLPGRRLRLAPQNSEYEDTIVRREEDPWTTEGGDYDVEFQVVGQYVGVVEHEEVSL